MVLLVGVRKAKNISMLIPVDDVPTLAPVVLLGTDETRCGVKIKSSSGSCVAWNKSWRQVVFIISVLVNITVKPKLINADLNLSGIKVLSHVLYAICS
jgi:hypothetical protein